MELVKNIEAYHGITMDIPGGYKVMKQAHSTTWLERDRLMTGSGLQHNTIEGLLIHHHAYHGKTDFSVLNLVDLRDSVTRVSVQGPVPGSYMIVQRNFETLDHATGPSGPVGWQLCLSDARIVRHGRGKDGRPFRELEHRV